MGLEAASFLEDLNTSNPDGAADTKAQGDDHIRLMKTVLKATFPGFSGRFGRVQAKAGNYGGVLTDNHTTISFSVDATLSLAAAATLGNGWQVNVYAAGGDVTVDPNGAELVSGAATYVVRKGSMAILICDGAGFILLEILPAVSGFSTGDAKLTIKTVADPGWVMANDGSIGSAASGATTRANADTEDLYILVWTAIANTEAPTQDNTGAPVARGASAAADFAANKRLVLPKTLGRALAIAGAGSGLTARVQGLATGAETVQLTQAQTPVKSHTHGVNDSGHAHGSGNGAPFMTETGGGGFLSYNAGPTSHPTTATTSTNGTGISIQAAADATADAHPNMQPTSFAFNAMIKL